MEIDETRLSHFMPLQAAACVEMDGNFSEAVEQASTIVEHSEAIGNLSGGGVGVADGGRANTLRGLPGGPAGPDPGAGFGHRTP